MSFTKLGKSLTLFHALFMALPVGKKSFSLHLDDSPPQSMAAPPPPSRLIPTALDRLLKRVREDKEIEEPRKKRKFEDKHPLKVQALALLKKANALAWKSKEKHEDLDEAIKIYSQAFYSPFHGEKLKAIILLNWGLALIRRNDPPKYSSEDEVPPEEIVYGRFSDADQAIARLHEGLVRIFNDANINARLQRGLGDAYLKKYESSNGEYDLTNALQYYQAGLIAPIPNAEIRAGLLKAKGKALILNKEHQKALSCFTEGLGLEFENEVLREGLQKSIQVVERLLEQSSSE